MIPEIAKFFLENFFGKGKISYGFLPFYELHWEETNDTIKITEEYYKTSPPQSLFYDKDIQRLFDDETLDLALLYCDLVRRNDGMEES